MPHKDKTHVFKRLLGKETDNRKSARAGAIRAVGRATLLNKLLPDDEEEKQRKKSTRA